jgi:Domain of unknown function (DUF4190)
VIVGRFNDKLGRWMFERNGNAVASLLLSLAGLVAYGVILGPIAVGLGLIGRSQIRSSGQPGIGAANTGIVLGVVAFIVPILLALT